MHASAKRGTSRMKTEATLRVTVNENVHRTVSESKRRILEVATDRRLSGPDYEKVNVSTRLKQRVGCVALGFNVPESRRSGTLIFQNGKKPPVVALKFSCRSFNRVETWKIRLAACNRWFLFSSRAAVCFSRRPVKFIVEPRATRAGRSRKLAV